MSRVDFQARSLGSTKRRRGLCLGKRSDTPPLLPPKKRRLEGCPVLASLKNKTKQKTKKGCPQQRRATHVDSSVRGTLDQTNKEWVIFGDTSPFEMHYAYGYES